MLIMKTKKRKHYKKHSTPVPPPDTDPVLSVIQVADRIKVSRPTVYKLIEQNRLEAIYINGDLRRTMRIRLSALENFLRGSRRLETGPGETSRP